MEAKPVEAVFVRVGLIWNVRAKGQVIKTTGEHPFYVIGKGWVNAAFLEAGDLFVGHDGEWTPIESVEATRSVETVYNLRVADFHTYFVGCDEWGWSVWAHNTFCGSAAEQAQKQAEVQGWLKRLGYSDKDAAKVAADYAKPGKAGDSLHKNLQTHIENGGKQYTAPGGYTRASESPKPRRPKDGVWTGEVGHSDFIPADPKSLGLQYGDVIPFRNGRPDFSKWTRDLNGNLAPGTSHKALQQLTGVEATDQQIFLRTLRDNFNARDGGGKWTLEKVQKWLQGNELTPHHSGGNDFQLLPWKLHGNPRADIPGVRHSGAAVDLRNN